MASRILSALVLLAGAFPIVASGAGLVEWNADQLEAYIIGVNAVLGAAGIILGVQVAKVVTPTANPRDDAGNPLTPGPIGSENAEGLPPI
ncbi:MAG: hypothetical protein R3330_08775 [Saprospiraceae bacterium]|nr:hypothetical protein [Saprospiraceae bacterium]